MTTTSESWARTHCKETGHTTVESLTDPGSCLDCPEKSPIHQLPKMTIMRDHSRKSSQNP